MKSFRDIVTEATKGAIIPSKNIGKEVFWAEERGIYNGVIGKVEKGTVYLVDSKGKHVAEQSEKLARLFATKAEAVEDRG